MNTAQPTLQFGRSWFVELKISSETALEKHSLEPFKFSIQLKNAVDPLSGMTLNLKTADETWAAAQELIRKSWPSVVEFLKAVSEHWQALAEREKIQLIRIKIETPKGNAWELSESGFVYTSVVQLHTTKTENTAPRKALLTSRKPLSDAEIKDFLSHCSLLRIENLLTCLQQHPFLIRLEIFDSFEQFIEYEIKK